MKISELTPISAIRRDIKIPLSVAGQNMSISLGQIIDAISQDVVPFSIIRNDSLNVAYAPGSETNSMGSVIFDKTTDKFYLCIGRSSTVAGLLVRHYTYFANWKTHDSFYDDEGNVRTDCLFVAADGRLYQFNGTTLISAGITEAQAKQIRLSTPIEVADEEEMERRIAAGEFEPGQIYFTAEEE